MEFSKNLLNERHSKTISKQAENQESPYVKIKQTQKARRVTNEIRSSECLEKAKHIRVRVFGVEIKPRTGGSGKHLSKKEAFNLHSR